MRGWPVLSVLLCAGVSSAGSFTFVALDQQAAPIIVAAGEPEYVRLAAEDLATDVMKITGKRPKVAVGGTPAAGACVLIGTKAGGAWESYRAEATGGRLAIEGGDARGTMFGVYAFIETYLKVDPLGLWSGNEPSKRPELKWDGVSLVSESPTFKFRGWFINDEDLLTEWMASGGTRKIDYQFYSHVLNVEAMRAVVEALVRSRFNLIIPSSFIDLMNPQEEALIQECTRRGVFVSQHHVEPMGVSAFAYLNYWKARGKELTYSYFSHPDEVREVWRAYAEKWAKFPNVIWQLGLRGKADRPMWMSDPNVPQSDEERGRIISEAMAAQVKILDAVCLRQPRLMTTTLWAEGAVLNQKGLLTVPADTMVVFADNSPGWKWQQDFYSTPHNPKNSYGVYYHHGLIGSGPHLAQAVPPHKTYDMLRAAVERDAGSYAMFNVSNVREFVLGIDATAKMTWRMDGFDPDVWLANWVKERFSQKQAEIENAYKIYFNAYQIHDRQRVPFLLDGQMFSAGNTLLREMNKKLKAKTVGLGTETEKVAREGGTNEVPKEADAFWSGLSDALPARLARRESVRRVAAQKAGFALASLHGHTAASHLAAPEAAFLNDNLIFPCDMMFQTCEWLEQLGMAQEALDLGNTKICVKSLESAEAAFAQIPGLVDGYCHDKWKTWYRGCKKLDVSAALAKTREVLEEARNNEK
jgi:hypothetical protein